MGMQSTIRLISFLSFAFLLCWFDCFSCGGGARAIVIRVSLLFFATGMLAAILVALRVGRLWQHDFELLQHLLHLYLIRIAEVQNCLTELVANLLKQVQIEVVVCKLALIRPTEAGFQGERISDVKLFPANDTRCGFFRLLYGKGAVREVENVTVLVHEAGEDAFF